MPSKYMTYQTKNRETGTTIQLFDTTHPDNKFDTAQRWVILCVEHDSTSRHEKQSDAYKTMTVPSSWCPDCADLKEEGGKVAGVSKPSEEEKEEEEEGNPEEVTIDPKE